MFARVFAAAVVLATTASLAVERGALAQDVDAQTGEPAGDVSVPGFRSANFGMDEAAVRAAITEDFDVEDAEIGKVENAVERTTALIASVPEVMEGGGAAEISYVLGYRTEALTQVSVLWSAETDPEMDEAQLLANGQVLQAYFADAGYLPGSVLLNTPVQDGLVLFRGRDAEGRMTLLLLLGQTVEAAPAESEDAASDAENPTATFRPEGLLLSYVARPDDPDVFQIEAGKF